MEERKLRAHYFLSILCTPFWLVFFVGSAFSLGEDQSRITKALLQSTIRQQEYQIEVQTRRVQHAQQRVDETKNPVFGEFFSTEGLAREVGKKTRFEIRSKADWSRAVADRKKELRDEKDTLQKAYLDPTPCLNLDDLKIGDVGFIGEAFAENGYGRGTIYRPASVKVIQILGPNSLLVSHSDSTFLVRDCSTVGMVDEKRVVFKRPFEVMGTETYTTAIGGSNTVYVLRVLGQSEYDAALKYVSENKIQLPKDFRTWRSISGEFQVEAEYVSHDKETVKLLRKDGKQLTVEIAKLSKADRLWLKDNEE